MMPCSYTIIKSIADHLSYDTSYAFSPTALKSSSCLENRHGGFPHAFSPDNAVHEEGMERSLKERF